MRHHGEHTELGPADRFQNVRRGRNGSAAQHKRPQDESRGADLDRLRSPIGDGRIGGDDEQISRAAVDETRDRHTGGPTETLFRIDHQLDLNVDHQDGAIAVEKNDAEIGAVFGGWLSVRLVEARRASV